MSAYSLVVYGAGTWGTISNVFFFGAAIFADLLILRFCLVMAYVFLLIFSLTGLPAWPHWFSDDAFLPWGMVMWAALCGVLHAIALFRHMWDERPIEFEGDTEQLFRCIHRRSGMGRVEFRELLKRGTWNRYKAGETIYLKGYSELCLHIVMEGVVEMCCEGDRGDWWNLYSGDMFDFVLFNLMGVYVGYDHEGGAIHQVNAKTDCLLFTWPASQVSEMAFGVSPAVSGFWRNLILYMIGTESTRWAKQNSAIRIEARDSEGQEEDPAFFTGARTRDMTRPLSPEELPPTGVKVWMSWLWQSISLWPPVGLRHTSLPSSGMRAVSRTMRFIFQHRIVASFKDRCPPRESNRKKAVLDTSPSSRRVVRSLNVSAHDERHPVVAPMLVRFASERKYTVIPPTPRFDHPGVDTLSPPGTLNATKTARSDRQGKAWKVWDLPELVVTCTDEGLTGDNVASQQYERLPRTPGRPQLHTPASPTIPE